MPNNDDPQGYTAQVLRGMSMLPPRPRNAQFDPTPNGDYVCTHSGVGPNGQSFVSGQVVTARDYKMLYAQRQQQQQQQQQAVYKPANFNPPDWGARPPQNDRELFSVQRVRNGFTADVAEHGVVVAEKMSALLTSVMALLTQGELEKMVGDNEATAKDVLYTDSVGGIPLNICKATRGGYYARMNDINTVIIGETLQELFNNIQAEILI